ncbi:MAG TPA: hypothetical protein VFE53_09705 [Mucilaginibacter sp.]|jgi:hypothetical protein|nr:hypothetical protein [Mucilaginibacter sp.]
MASFTKADKQHRIILLLVYLYVLILGMMIITVPPGFDPDSGWGFMVMHNMEQGAAFNRLVSPDPANIAANQTTFLSWWSPGQYLVPYFLRVSLNINNGHAISLSVISSSLLGLTGFYMFFKKLGFTRLIAALSTAFIATQLFFIQQFVYYNGGELLLFAFLGWFLYGCLSFSRITWKTMLFMFFAGLVGFFLKSSVLWMLSAGAICIWLNVSLAGTGRLPGETNLRSVFARRGTILTLLRNGALVFLPLVAAFTLISFFYLSRGENPSNYSGPLHFVPESVVFPLASPLTSGLSIDELVDGLIYQPDGQTVSYHLAIAILSVLSMFSLVFVWLLIKFRPGRNYLVAFLSFYVVGCLFFCYMFLKQFPVSYEGRHFRIIGLLTIPGIIHLLYKWRFSKVVFFVCWAAFAYVGMGYFVKTFAGNRHAARGSLGLSESLYDTTTMKEILQLDNQHPNDAVFVVMSPDIGAEIIHNRVIAIDDEMAANGDFSSINYKGKGGRLFILLPAVFITAEKAPAILKSFTDYHRFSSKRLSPGYYLFSASD